MLDNKVLEKIRKEAESFGNVTIPLTKGGSLEFNQADTLRMINHYVNSEFTTGDKDEDGFQKYFFNVVNKSWRTAAKATDIDTKHVKLEAEDGQSYYPTWFLEKELQVWMKEQGFAALLNDIVAHTPKYGSTVVKKTGDKNIEITRLDNLSFDPSVEKLEDSHFVTEEHVMSPEELYSYKDKWDKAEEALDLWFSKNANRKLTSNDIRVYESYRRVKRGEIEKGSKKGDELVWGMFLVADIGKNDSSKPVYLDDPIVVKELPYKEIHWEKVFGRWLGRGVVEEGFMPQQRQNLLINLIGKAMYWSSKIIFQSRSSMDKNLATQTLNGEVLEVDEEVTRIPIEQRDLSSFNTEFARWKQNYAEQTFNYDIMRGERPPSGTPLGTSQMQFSMIQSYFEGKKDNLGIFIKEILKDWIIPLFLQDKSKEHTFNLIGSAPEELEKFDNFQVNNRVKKKVLDFVKDNGYLPTKLQREVISKTEKTKQKNPDKRLVDIPKSFYKNVKYTTKIIITGEAIDMGSELQTLQVILQQLSTNPRIFENPMIKKIFYKILDKVGISPVDFQVDEQEQQSTPLPQGGSVAVPPTPNIPIRQKEQEL